MSKPIVQRYGSTDPLAVILVDKWDTSRANVRIHNSKAAQAQDVAVASRHEVGMEASVEDSRAESAQIAPQLATSVVGPTITPVTVKPNP